MTAFTVPAERSQLRPRIRRGSRRLTRPQQVTGPAPTLDRRLQLVRAMLVLTCVISGALLVELLLVSRLQESAAQGRLFDRFRSELATGTAPTGPIDNAGNVVVLGAPVAFLEIPSIDLRVVVAEGTSSGVLFDAPGHRRDTPLPGQIGSSVVYGRRAAFGGPFANIDSLRKGAVITVTTGQGRFTFTVLGIRRGGDPIPAAAAAGTARLQLVTADGSAFVPDGVLRVDAELDATKGVLAVVGPTPLITVSALPAEERVMAGDTRSLWVLALWMQALIVLSLCVVWAWHRWGRAQAWVVFLPPLVLVALAASGEVVRLLPNLL